MHYDVCSQIRFYLYIDVRYSSLPTLQEVVKSSVNDISVTKVITFCLRLNLSYSSTHTQRWPKVMYLEYPDMKLGTREGRFRLLEWMASPPWNPKPQ